ncbi:MAG: UDP-N-acetylglucosamine--N-acetylmuramyl-(pentapeptide) pyrophosphoryl-undecaprenol N-acetylglucosamine transferase [Candidatus Magasanikbacteria bacterium]|nr:UDP-N-acetylglucosamine--N-acetylmuramyl-(pentapeptide) pyrophosphoryl-undecaprenol N-acetylglucosamine transferase [Candidatus Magasanikbacteria bacterium]
MKIILSGGGTLGPVTPLLAIRETIQKQYPDAQFLWVGTKRGPERELLQELGIEFTTLASGKFRRYLSLWNVIDIARIFIGFFQSLRLLLQENPDVCISAGGFISVPLHWAAWFLGIPTWIHQQDIQIGLANRLMAPFARVVTTSLQKNLSAFSKKKAIWLGNPVRADIMKGNIIEAQKLFNLTKDKPVVFATGGGTGSLRVNQMIVEAMPHLKDFVQMIHLSGKERPQELVGRAANLYSDYHTYQFFTDEMKHAYAIADIIISRGGFGTLTEIAALGKIAIIIPKPGHQVENLRFLEQQGAAIFVNEKIADGLYLAKIVRQLLENEIQQKQLAYNLNKLLPRAKEEDILNVLARVIA